MPGSGDARKCAMLTPGHGVGGRPVARRRPLPALPALCLATAAALAGPCSGHAQSPEEFYKGRSVTLLIPFDVGSGYDTYARAVARHIGRFIPGAPIWAIKPTA